jgi:hypothetical protein
VDFRFYGIEMRTGHVYPIIEGRWAELVGWSGDGEWLIVRMVGSSRSTFTWALFRVRPNGTGLAILSGNLRVLNTFDWSPDREWLYFEGFRSGDDGQRIFRVRIEDATLEAVTDGGAMFARGTWSADGDWYYYSAQRNLETDVYRLNVVTGEEQQLTTFEDKDYVIGWSPDEEWLYVQNNHDPNNMSSVYAMRADGSHPVLMFQHPRLAPQVTKMAVSDSGKWLIFQIGAYPNQDHYVLDIDTQAVGILSQSQARQFVGFSDDDTWAIFLGGAPEPIHSHLVRIHIEDGHTEDITPTNIETLFRAEFSPDGEPLYADAFIGKNKVVGVVNMESGELEPLHETFWHNNQQPVLVGWVTVKDNDWAAWRLVGLSGLMGLLSGGDMIRRARQSI